MEAILFILAPQLHPVLQISCKFSSFPATDTNKWRQNINLTARPAKILSCLSSTVVSAYQTEEEDERETVATIPTTSAEVGAPTLRHKRRRYRKLYPGEKNGITEEMRFIAMKLRNSGKTKKRKSKIHDQHSEESANGSSDSDGENVKDEILVHGSSDSDDGNEKDEILMEEEEKEEDGGGENGKRETWQPSMEGLLKYLVDSKLVFSTIERIVDESLDVSYAYFRKTGLERTERLSKDLEWLRQEGNLIPEASNPGINYVKYLEELGEQSPNLFLSHFYNIYYSHIAGGQLISRRVCDELLQGRELEFCRWEGEEEESLRLVREKLNALGEHWTRDEKNKCLKEATKAFRYLGQIVRLIIL